MRKKQRELRIFFYFFGFFIMTLGIAFSVKSNLGVSPVSSIPYTMTCILGIEMGKATIIFHLILVLFQIILLRKQFEIKNLLQIGIGIIFGYFTTFCNYLVSFAPTPENLIIRIGMILISIILIAFGIFLYVPANIMPLAGEGTMLAVSKVIGKEFAQVKIAFDVSMVLISLLTCLIILHSFGSVGVGTVLAAVLVGAVLKIITRYLGEYFNKLFDVN